VDAGNILRFLHQRFGNMIRIISFISQQGEVHNEHAIMFGDGINENLEERNFISFPATKDT